MFAPAIETVDAVKSWLAAYGISEDRIAVSSGSNWIRFNSTVAEAESLLQTKYKESIPASPVNSFPNSNAFRFTNMLKLRSLILRVTNTVFPRP